MRLLTPRLELVPADGCLASSMLTSRAELGWLVAARVPAEWPPGILADALELLAQRSVRSGAEAGWWVWLVVLRSERVLIGSVGCKGPPDATGRVDIGCSVLDAYQRRGYATEAVTALVAWVSEDARVTHVIAETFAHPTSSIRVLQNAGSATSASASATKGSPRSCS